MEWANDIPNILASRQLVTISRELFPPREGGCGVGVCANPRTRSAHLPRNRLSLHNLEASVKAVHLCAKLLLK